MLQVIIDFKRTLRIHSVRLEWPRGSTNETFHRFKNIEVLTKILPSSKPRNKLSIQVHVLNLASDGSPIEESYCNRVNRVVSLSLTIDLRCLMPITGNGLRVKKVSPPGFGGDFLDLDEVLVLAEGTYLKTGNPISMI